MEKVKVKLCISMWSGIFPCGAGWRLIDPAELRIFVRIRSRIKGFLRKEGRPLCGGYLMAVARLPAIEHELQGFQAAWNAAKADFFAAYPDKCQEWRDANPEWAAALALWQPNQTEVFSYFKFDYQIAPLNTDTLLTMLGVA